MGEYAINAKLWGWIDTNGNRLIYNEKAPSQTHCPPMWDLGGRQIHNKSPFIGVFGSLPNPTLVGDEMGGVPFSYKSNSSPL